jgi:hypothetical protein
MIGRSGRWLAAAGLLAAALAATGCCGLTGGRTIGNRDTPEAAFEFVRSAFAEDRTLDQLNSLHWLFQGRQGINSSKYEMARTLRPGLFAKAARVLGAAKLEKVEYAAKYETKKGPEDAPRLREAARVSLTTPEGSGVFILVDEPTWLLVTLEKGGATVVQSGQLTGLDGVVGIRDGQVVAELRRPLDFPPEEAPRILRLEIHHDWLLFDVESLQGFEEFLGEVKATAEKAAEAPEKRQEAPR